MVSDGQSFAVNQPVDLFVPSGAPLRVFINARECDLPRMDPCVGTPEVADGNDSPGDIVASFPSADAAVGDHTLHSPNQDPPYGNPNGAKAPDYLMTLSIRRVVDPAGTVVQASPPGSTGVPSSSPGGTLGGGGGGTSTVLVPPQKHPAAGCASARPPRSRIYRGRLSSRRAIRLSGTAVVGRCAAIARVQVAVARLVGHRCRFVGPGDRLAGAGSCARGYFRLARGASRWRLTITGRFPRGQYLVLARATDTIGQVELQRQSGNTTRFVIP